MNNTYPAIQLNYVAESLSSYVAQIAYGIEEEGLFSVSSLIPVSDLAERTYAAARASKVGIALGISAEEIFLMHRKAGPDTFLLRTEFPLLTESEGRLFGKNAARLVKGLPLCQK